VKTPLDKNPANTEEIINLVQESTEHGTEKTQKGKSVLDYGDNVAREGGTEW